MQRNCGNLSGCLINDYVKRSIGTQLFWGAQVMMEGHSLYNYLDNEDFYSEL